MNLVGVHLTLMIGTHEPRRAPPEFVEALQSVEVTLTDRGPSGFQMTFQIGRASAADITDFRLLRGPLLKPFNRVALIVDFAFRPQVLMDGIITNIQMSPSEEPGQSRLVVTGEDISLLMDLEEKQETYPNVTNYNSVVVEILDRYREYIDPGQRQIENISDEEETHDVRQDMSDRAYLYQLAWELGFVFYVTPGGEPSKNQAYFGPKPRGEITQPALAFNMGPHSNVDSISFTYDGMRPATVVATIASERNGEIAEDSVMVMGHTLQPAMASQNPAYSEWTTMRQVFLRYPVSSLDEATSRAQAMANQAAEEVVTAQGELDALRYGQLLQPRAKVGLRGVGQTFDGNYYVSSVTHSIQRGKYKQRFSLSREGVGALSWRVRP